MYKYSYEKSVLENTGVFYVSEKSIRRTGGLNLKWSELEIPGILSTKWLINPGQRKL